MILTLTPAPNYPILFVHFLENINYPLRCTKLWFFLTRLWVPADRVLSLWSPVAVSRGRAPERSPNTVYVAAGDAEDVAGAPQGLSLSRWESVISLGSSLLAGRGRGGRRPCAWGSRAASASTPFSSSAWCGPPAGGVPLRPSEPETRTTTDAKDRPAAAATRTRAVGLQTRAPS